jgi:hypothetical protein
MTIDSLQHGWMPRSDPIEVCAARKLLRYPQRVIPPETLDPGSGSGGADCILHAYKHLAQRPYISEVDLQLNHAPLREVDVGVIEAWHGECSMQIHQRVSRLPVAEDLCVRTHRGDTTRVNGKRRDPFGLRLQQIAPGQDHAVHKESLGCKRMAEHHGRHEGEAPLPTESTWHSDPDVSLATRRRRHSAGFAAKGSICIAS